MAGSVAQLPAALRLPPDCNDDEITLTLVALLTSAVNDEEPAISLPDLCKIISIDNEHRHLDPLNMLPILIPVNHRAAGDMMFMIGQFGSAKEVVIAVQEAAERLFQSFATYSEETEIDDNTDTKPIRIRRNTPMQELKTLIDLSAAAIPRLGLRRKTAPETIKPLFQELGAILKVANSSMDRSEAITVISSNLKLLKNVGEWVESVTKNSLEDKQASQVIMKEYLDGVALACVPNVQSFIAERTFEECLSRYVVRSTIGSDWKEADVAVLQLLDVYKSLDVNLHVCSGPVSVAHLVASAYQPALDAPADKRLAFLLPVLVSSLKTNVFLDESLAVVLRSLHAWKPNPETPHRHLSPDVTVPLVSILPSIASIHPNPSTRHQTFRVVSLLLATSERRLRFQHLAELTGQSEFPQMRVAAVGLIKEHFLSVFNASSDRLLRMQDDPFLNPVFLRTFGPILFRPHPQDLFEERFDLKSFQEGSEPARLSECLSLYFLLLQRDEKNLTGIRDKGVSKTIEYNLLEPLRQNLSQWIEDPTMQKGHGIRLASLCIGIERVDAARKALML